MSSSPTVKLDPTLIIGQLSICCQYSERNVSLDESCTKMEEFISMFSLISDGSFRQERLTYSMWEAVTLTSCQLGQLRERCTTMQSRMETVLRVASNDRAQTAILTLTISGLQQRIANLWRSFCTFATVWLQEISSVVSQTSKPTLTGNGEENQAHTLDPRALGLTRQKLHESLSGCVKLIWGLDQLD